MGRDSLGLAPLGHLLAFPRLVSSFEIRCCPSFPPEEKLSFRTLCKVQPNSNRSGTLGGFFFGGGREGGKGRVAQGIVV